MQHAPERPLRILVIEDDPDHLALVARALERLGVETRHAGTRAEAMRQLAQGGVDAAVCDLELPDGSGLEIQRWLARSARGCPLVFVSAHDRAEDAVAALRAGALDYVVKSSDFPERVAGAVRSIAGACEQPSPGPPAPSRSALPSLVGDSPAMLRVRRLIDDYGPAEAPVLVSGETGTGKELVARALHRASPRASGPFVAVNCAAISGSLFESEVFGSVRGAYTGAVRNRLGLVSAASRGVLFLDEVGELSAAGQAKLLRFLESGVYRCVGSSREAKADVRVVAATNRPLTDAVASGAFRTDLFYRLHVLRIHVAPLRERLQDIPLLVKRFLSRIAPARSAGPPTSEALAQLMAWSWPGNVRELEHVIERTVLRAGSGPIARFDLADEVSRLDPHGARGQDPQGVAETLVRNRGRLGPAAAELGVSIRTLQRRMKRFGMTLRDFRLASETRASVPPREPSLAQPLP